MIINNCFTKIQINAPISIVIVLLLYMDADLYCCSLAKQGKHEAAGWPNTAYGVSKIGVTVMCMIQQRQLDAEKREDIIVNAVCLQFYMYLSMKAIGQFLVGQFELSFCVGHSLFKCLNCILYIIWERGGTGVITPFWGYQHCCIIYIFLLDWVVSQQKKISNNESVVYVSFKLFCGWHCGKVSQIYPDKEMLRSEYVWCICVCSHEAN